MSKKRRAAVVLLLLAGAVGIAACVTTSFGSSLGSSSTGERRARMERSPEWHGSQFANTLPMTEMAEPGSEMPLSAWIFGPEQREPTSPLPVDSAAAARLKSPPTTGLRATWLGHSTTILEIDGVRILTDPQWSERASPSTAVGPHRFQPPPLPLEDALPVDAVIISHDHYDHLDMETVKRIDAAVHPIFLVGLGVGAHLEGWGIDKARIAELDWGDERVVTGAHGSIRVVCTAAQHFSGRRGVDVDHTLWTSWSLVGPAHRVYFSGDTGLFKEMADIGARYGPFDLALLEIGQYHPAWGLIHLGPKNAERAFSLLNAKALLPIHWGMFNLAIHAWNGPVETLYEDFAASGAGAQLYTPRLAGSVEPGVLEPHDAWWR